MPGRSVEPATAEGCDRSDTAASSATASPEVPMYPIVTAQSGLKVLSGDRRISANHPNMTTRSRPSVPRIKTSRPGWGRRTPCAGMVLHRHGLAP